MHFVAGRHLYGLDRVIVSQKLNTNFLSQGLPINGRRSQFVGANANKRPLAKLTEVSLENMFDMLLVAKINDKVPVLNNKVLFENNISNVLFQCFTFAFSNWATCTGVNGGKGGGGVGGDVGNPGILLV